MLPIAVAAARRLGLKRLLLPPQNAAEASVVEGLDVCIARSLPEAVDALNKPDEAQRAATMPRIMRAAAVSREGDLADVRGQPLARRALEVAAAGGHNLLLERPPGAGKTMMARRLGSILPPLTFDEALECTAIHSVAGTLPPGVGLLSERPFRAPHHTVSNVALVGGGHRPAPGRSRSRTTACSSSTKCRSSIGALSRCCVNPRGRARDDRSCRANRRLPCPVRAGCCDESLSLRVPWRRASRLPVHADTDCPVSRQASGPLRDRIDLIVDVPAVPVSAIADGEPGEPSVVVRERVLAARTAQQRRYGSAGARTNADLRGSAVAAICRPDADGRTLLSRAATRMGLRARLRPRAGGEDGRRSRRRRDVTAEHVAEALQYRLVE